jgi:uncharacterized membrane protein YqjE
MQTPSDNEHPFGDATKRIARRVFVIVENRLQLLMVEAQEERGRLLLAILLALCATAFALLAGVTLTVMIAVALWEHSAIIALLVLAAIYTIAAVGFYGRLFLLQRNWETLPGTLEQLKKDRQCLRVQLLNELRDLNHEIHFFKSQVQAIGALISLAAKLAATFSAIGSAFTHREAGENGKSSWLSTLINGARTGPQYGEQMK